MSAPEPAFIIATQCFPQKNGAIESLMNGMAKSFYSRGLQTFVYTDGKGEEAEGFAESVPFSVKYSISTL